MNIKRLLEKVTDNWPSKIICFILALLIYFFHQMSILQKKTFTVPVKISAEGSMLVSSESDELVKITIRGKEDELSTVTENDLTAFLDISNITKEGKYNIPVNVRTSPRLRLMEPLELSVKPDTIAVEMEERIYRFVPIKATMKGSVEHGFEIKSVNIEPSTVKIEGPRTIVDSISSIQTDGVDVFNLTDSINRTVGLLNGNKLIFIDTKTNVDVQVNIEPSIMTRQFEKLPITVSYLDQQLEIKNFSSSIDTQIEGKVIDLENLSDKYISPYIDCSKITEAGTYEFAVYIKIPVDMKILSQSTDKITVEIEEKKIEELNNSDVENPSVNKKEDKEKI